MNGIVLKKKKRNKLTVNYKDLVFCRNYAMDDAPNNQFINIIIIFFHLRYTIHYTPNCIILWKCSEILQRISQVRP